MKMLACSPRRGPTGFLIFAAFLLATCFSAQGQLVLYPFAGDSLNSTASLGNANATPMSEGPGIDASLTFFSGTTGNPAPSWVIHTASTGGGAAGSLSTAIANNDYISFTITPDAGYALNLTGISLNLRGSSTSPHTPWTQVGITYDPDNNGTFTQLTLNSTATLPNTGNLASRNAVLTDTEITNAVTFRIYFWGGNRGVVDNIRLDGSVTAVPEPGSFALLALAAGLAASFRRTCRRGFGVREG